MSKKSALANAGAPVALPKENYLVGNYQGYEDNEYHWSTPKSKTGSPVTFGSLVHDAKTNAAKHDVPFPAELGRPGVHERLHKSGIKFEDHSDKAGTANDDADEEWGPPLLSMADISGPAPARQWAAGKDGDGWVPLGDVTFLYGPDGVGKTLLAGQICLAAARGGDLCSIPFQKMPALLIACEDDEGELHRRFEKQGKRPKDQVYFASFGGYDTRLNRRPHDDQDTPFYQYIARKLEEMGDEPKLLVLDNLFQIYQGGYIDPAEIAPFINFYCRRLALDHNATVIVLAHPSMSQKQSGEGGYGGVGWSAGVRNRLYFDFLRDERGNKISDIRLLSRKKANYATVHEQNEGIHVRWDDWKFRLSTDEDVQFQVQVVDVAEAEAVFRYIHENDFPKGFSIARNVAAGERKLVSKKISCNLGHGAYQLSAERIRRAAEHLSDFGLLREYTNPNGNIALRCKNPHKSEALFGICDEAELEAMCEEFLSRGRRPPRDPEEHTPSEPVKVREPQRRKKRGADAGPFEPQRKRHRRKRKG